MTDLDEPLRDGGTHLSQSGNADMHSVLPLTPCRPDDCARRQVTISSQERQQGKGGKASPLADGRPHTELERGTTHV